MSDDINVGAISESLNNKVDLNCNNISEGGGRDLMDNTYFQGL